MSANSLKIVSAALNLGTHSKSTNLWNCLRLANIKAKNQVHGDKGTVTKI